MRPLLLAELDLAIRIQLREDITRLDESLRALCGQLVIIDKSGRVQMIHETARDFMLSGEVESEFCVRKTDAHTQLARACLTYLTSDEMKPPRTARRRSNVQSTGANHFRITLYEPILWPMIFHDLSTTSRNATCSRVSNLCRTGELSPLIQAANHFGKYVRALATERSPLGKEIQ